MTSKELIERIERGEKWTGLEGHLEGLAEAHSKILKENETLRQQLAEALALIEASRKESLEMAAKVCEGLHKNDQTNILYAAKTIRALKDSIK